MSEFDVNVHRNKMKELMMLKQTGTVTEYKREFSQLTYQLLLYENSVSDTFLVTRFVLGLKEELRAAVELQLPATVSEAAIYAGIQEDILSRQRQVRWSSNKYSLRSQIIIFLAISNGLQHTDVYRHVLECRFTHFAPSVSLVEISKNTNI